MSAKRQFKNIQIFNTANGCSFVAIAEDGTAWISPFDEATGGVAGWRPLQSLPDAPAAAPQRISKEAVEAMLHGRR